MQEFVDILKRELTCSECNLISSSLLQCELGHTICIDCFAMLKHDVTHCKVCNSVNFCYNKSVIRVASDLKVCVRCGIDDCQEEVCVEELKMHRIYCKHKTFGCPVYKFCDPVTSDMLYSHVSEHLK